MLSTKQLVSICCNIKPKRMFFGMVQLGLSQLKQSNNQVGQANTTVWIIFLGFVTLFPVIPNTLHRTLSHVSLLIFCTSVHHVSQNTPQTHQKLVNWKRTNKIVCFCVFLWRNLCMVGDFRPSNFILMGIRGWHWILTQHILYFLIYIILFVKH